MSLPELRRVSIGRFVTQYPSIVRATLRLSGDKNVGGLWRFALASLAFLVLGLIGLAGVVIEANRVGALLFSLACFAVAVANMLFVSTIARRRGLV